ncbi:MAG: hypothetical protein K6E91_01240 [Butyrivibrio sp.]|nr:hypothetical protein [Butyrivibrio sp.]
MNIEKIYRQRRNVLRVLADEFGSEMVPAKVVRSDGTDIDDSDPQIYAGTTQILTVLFEDLTSQGIDAIGEFFFIPYKEDDDMQIFQNVITLDEEVEEEMLPEILLAITALNNVIPVGSFGVDLAQRRMAYRHSYEMPFPLSDSDLKNFLDLCMGMAVSMVKEFAYLLAEVADGSRSAESVVQLFDSDQILQ